MIKKIFIRIIIIVFALIFLLISAALIIAYLYKDDVKTVVINELNKRLTTEVNVKDVEFSLLSKFPSASINLIDIVAKSPDSFNKKDFTKINTDTLFSADNLFLEFNVPDIIDENYTLKSIDAKNGRLNIFIDRKGNDNLKFWKEDTTSSGSNFEIKLNKLIFNKIYLCFYNLSQDLILRTRTNKLVFKGDFASDDYSLATYGYFRIYEFHYDDVDYFNSNNVALNLDLQAYNNYYKITRGNIQVEDLDFQISGDVKNAETNTVNLSVKGKNLNIKSFLSILPEKYKKDIKDYRSSGKFYFDMEINGEVDNIKSPHISADFGINNGIIQRKGTNIVLENVNLDGKFSNGAKNNSITTSLVLDSFNLNIGGGDYSGKFRMENLKQPKIELIGKGEIDLELFQEFFQIDTIENLSGFLSTDFKFSCVINNPSKLSVEDFRKAKSEGKIELKQTSLKIKDSPYEISNANGNFTFKNSDLKIDSLFMTINENDFILHGYFNNIVSYLLVDNQKLSITGEICSKSVNLNKLISYDSEQGDDISYKFPENIYINTTINIDNFIFNKFNAQSVRGKFKFIDNSLSGSPLMFNTMDGLIKSTFTIKQNADNSFTTKVYATLTSIDIKKLFYSFNNFDQDFIQDKHLNGNINADVTYSSDWDNKFNVDTKSIIADCDITVKNGQLVDFEPMERLSNFIELEELMNIKFDRLENSIMIKNEKVIIPKMEIKSSAFEIELSGEHYFDYRIDYKVKVLLSDILAKKAKKNKKENNEFGQIEDDGLGRTSIYLSIKGTVDDYKISYDTKNVITHIKEELQEEKTNLKMILNEEFGWFKKDSAVIQAKNKENEKNKNGTGIKVIWDDETTDSSSVSHANEDEDDW